MSKPAILMYFGKGGCLSRPPPPLCHPSTRMNVDLAPCKGDSWGGEEGGTQQGKKICI